MFELCLHPFNRVYSGWNLGGKTEMWPLLIRYRSMRDFSFLKSFISARVFFMIREVSIASLLEYHTHSLRYTYIIVHLLGEYQDFIFSSTDFINPVSFGTYVRQPPILFFGGWWWMLSTWAVGAAPPQVLLLFHLRVTYPWRKRLYWWCHHQNKLHNLGLQWEDFFSHQPQYLLIDKVLEAVDFFIFCPVCVHGGSTHTKRLLNKRCSCLVATLKKKPHKFMW